MSKWTEQEIMEEEMNRLYIQLENMRQDLIQAHAIQDEYQREREEWVLLMGRVLDYMEVMEEDHDLYKGEGRTAAMLIEQGKMPDEYYQVKKLISEQGAPVCDATEDDS